jgi:1-aminocyclopropane-1-carboxylate deaminase/D-cysteine desulfhydrase-like pyridoxal-dependent ACC family enzyme
VPTATGGTQAGLLVGAHLGIVPMPRVHGVVVGKSAPELQPVIEALVRAASRMAGIDPPMADIELDESQLGPGYGMTTEAAEEATRLLARSEGMLVDPVYSAKGLAGLISLVRAGDLDGRRAIFWHGGGLPALFEDLDAGAAKD